MDGKGRSRYRKVMEARALVSTAAGRRTTPDYDDEGTESRGLGAKVKTAGSTHAGRYSTSGKLPSAQAASGEACDDCAKKRAKLPSLDRPKPKTSSTLHPRHQSHATPATACGSDSAASRGIRGRKKKVTYMNGRSVKHYNVGTTETKKFAKGPELLSDR